MSWIWPLLTYFLGVFIGIAITNRLAYRRGYRRGVQDGMAKQLYTAYRKYSEQQKEEQHDRSSN